MVIVLFWVINSLKLGTMELVSVLYKWTMIVQVWSLCKDSNGFSETLTNTVLVLVLRELQFCLAWQNIYTYFSFVTPSTWTVKNVVKISFLFLLIITKYLY